MRVAYIVLSHQLVEQVARLVRVLLDESRHARVVVHHDAGAGRLVLPHRSGLELVVPPLPVSRGDLSVVRATLRALEWLERDGDYDWVTLLSGQDYPVAPLEASEQALAATPYEGFVRVRWTPESRRLCRERYLRRWYTVRLPGRRRRTRVGLPWNRVFGAEFRCFKASQWWTLSRAVIRDLLATAATHRRYWSQYHRSLIPDESFLQTLALNGRRRIHPDNRRFVRWPAPGVRHPDVLTARDVDAVTASGAWFARKFDMGVCGEALTLLDRRRWNWGPAAAQSGGGW